MTEEMELLYLRTLWHMRQYKRSRWAAVEEAKILYDECKAFKPELVVECGTANGWSILWLAAAAPNARIVTYDAVKRDILMEHPRVEYRVESFCDNVKDLLNTNEKTRKLFFIDGDHRQAKVRKDRKAIKPYCQSGDLVLFHDTSREPGVRWLMERLKGEKRVYSTGRGVTAYVVPKEET